MSDRKRFTSQGKMLDSEYMSLFFFFYSTKLCIVQNNFVKLIIVKVIEIMWFCLLLQNNAYYKTIHYISIKNRRCHIHLESSGWYKKRFSICYIKTKCPYTMKSFIFLKIFISQIHLNKYKSIQWKIQTVRKCIILYGTLL